MLTIIARFSWLSILMDNATSKRQSGWSFIPKYLFSTYCVMTIGNSKVTRTTCSHGAEDASAEMKEKWVNHPTHNINLEIMKCWKWRTQLGGGGGWEGGVQVFPCWSPLGRGGNFSAGKESALSSPRQQQAWQSPDPEVAGSAQDMEHREWEEEKYERLKR